ncbi:hypothetical protein MZM54_03355 [[Brevibacterium] frigoritolerans]|nr:hypothetical protein [Peribacillus frigoritolerans]
MSQILVDVAYSLGVKAQKNEMKRVPAWDKELLENCLKGLKVEDPIGVKILDAWLKGWDEANLGLHNYSI